MDLTAFSRDFTRVVAEASGAMRDLHTGDWALPRGEDKWSRLEVLGHLIDSAINNHQRFVRALTEDSLEWPNYDQVAMVEVQRFGGMPPTLLVTLWESLNLYLARLIAVIPEEKLGTPCKIGTNPFVSLEQLVESYVDHLQHHLDQIFEGLDSPYRRMSVK
jgi:hypothetical protein